MHSLSLKSTREAFLDCSSNFTSTSMTPYTRSTSFMVYSDHKVWFVQIDLTNTKNQRKTNAKIKNVSSQTDSECLVILKKFFTPFYPHRYKPKSPSLLCIWNQDGRPRNGELSMATIFTKIRRLWTVHFPVNSPWRICIVRLKIENSELLRYFQLAWTQVKHCFTMLRPSINVNWTSFKRRELSGLQRRLSTRGGGGLLGLMFAGYVPLASQSPYHIIFYFVANYRLHLSHFLENVIFAIPT